MSVRVYITSIEPLDDQRLFNSLYDRMPEYRQHKIDRLVMPKDKQRSLAAGLLFEYALKEAGITKPEISEGENGKPFLKEYPQFFFNISHSGDFALCVVANSEVGCDVETITGDANLDIAKRFFTNEEYEMIVSKPDDESKRELFFRLWTLKETFIKLTGVGMSMPLNEFSFTISGYDVKIKHGLGNYPCSFRTWVGGGNYMYAIGVKGKEKLDALALKEYSIEELKEKVYES